MNLQHKQQHDLAPEISYWQIHIGWVYITDMNSDSGSVFISIKNRIPSWKHEKLREGGVSPCFWKTSFIFIAEQCFDPKVWHRFKDNVYPDDDPSGKGSALSFTHVFLSDPHLCVCVCLCYIWLIRGLGCRVLGWRGPIILFLVFGHVYIVITEDSHTKHG